MDENITTEEKIRAKYQDLLIAAQQKYWAEIEQSKEDGNYQYMEDVLKLEYVMDCEIINTGWLSFETRTTMNLESNCQNWFCPLMIAMSFMNYVKMNGNRVRLTRRAR